MVLPKCSFASNTRKMAFYSQSIFIYSDFDTRFRLSKMIKHDLVY